MDDVPASTLEAAPGSSIVWVGFVVFVCIQAVE